MTSPSDRLPLELMLPHQLRMLTGPRGSIDEVVILDNRNQSWLGRKSPHDGFLDKLEWSEVAAVKAVNYTTFDEPSFLQRFFKLRSSRGCPAPENVTVRALVEVGGMKMATNLLGMLHVLEQCLADPGVELCVYIDSDIFLHRRGDRGLVEVSPAIFSEHPEAVALQPPSLCAPLQQFDALGASACKASQEDVASSRHLILNRSRLAALLPFSVRLQDFSFPYAGMFEDALRAGLRLSRGLWTMTCGAELVAVHPPHNRYEMGFDEQLAALAAHGYFHPTLEGFPEATVAGARTLIRRIEAGRFSSFHDYCTNMRPSLARIEAGMAW